MLMKHILFSTYGEYGVMVTDKTTSISAWCDHESSEFKNRDAAIKKLDKKINEMQSFLDSVNKIKKFVKPITNK